MPRPQASLRRSASSSAGFLPGIRLVPTSACGGGPATPAPPVSSPPKSTRLAGAPHFLMQQCRRESEGHSSRIIKVDKLLPDDFESIADVGEPLQAFAANADHSQIRSRRNLVMPSVG